MEQRYLIDTNVIIDNFGDKLPENAKKLIFNIDINISAVTQIEVLGWKNATKKQLKPLYEFIQITNILPIDNQIINKTIQIRQTKKITLGDAIIAATAIIHKLTLITRNTDDFKNIEFLEIINPYEI